MREKDNVTKGYLKDPAIFADAFNKYLYHGKQVILPEQLRELDTSEMLVPYGDDGRRVPQQRYRDVLKLVMTDGNAAYCILGIESQSKVNYAMPVRNMVYDALQLAGQVTETAKMHRTDKKGDYKPTSDEFLSGFYKTDKLLPVMTLVLYFDGEEWDGPLSLKEMYAQVDQAMMRYAPDYRLNLIAPGRMSDEEMEEFHTSLKEVMKFAKYAKDKKKLRKVLEEDENFRRLDRQAAEVIRVVTNLEIRYEEEEEVDMCIAVREMIEDGRMEGRRAGRREGILSSIQNLMKNLSLSAEQAMKVLEIPQSEQEFYLKKLS